MKVCIDMVDYEVFDDLNEALGVVHHFSDGLYAKQMMLKKGYWAVSHSHNYDHLSILATGVAEVTTDDETVVYIAPACIQIKKGVNHGILALEDATWFCIHATNETDPDKVDEVLIQPNTGV